MPWTFELWELNKTQSNLYFKILFFCTIVYTNSTKRIESGRSRKTPPNNNGTYECISLQLGNSHVINLKRELCSHFKGERGGKERLRWVTYLLTHRINQIYVESKSSCWSKPSWVQRLKFNFKIFEKRVNPIQGNLGKVSYFHYILHICTTCLCNFFNAQSRLFASR